MSKQERVSIMTVNCVETCLLSGGRLAGMLRTGQAGSEVGTIRPLLHSHGIISTCFRGTAYGFCTHDRVREDHEDVVFVLDVSERGLQS